MSCVPVRGCRIGEGRPKVILPIVERTEAATLEKAAAFSTLCADCVEWRVDLFEAAADPGAVVRCLAKLRVLLREKLLLVTLRTKEEGGSIPVSHEGYLRFLHTILDTQNRIAIPDRIFLLITISFIYTNRSQKPFYRTLYQES